MSRKPAHDAAIDWVAGQRRLPGPDIAASIAEQIRRAIFGGELLPGTPLGEQKLCSIFAVSRARIRSVLQTLAEQRLVSLVPNQGARIARPSVEEARNLFEARRAIESVTTSLAAKVILTSQLADLRRQIERQDRANKTGQFTQALLELGRFHQQLARLSNNGVLVEVIEPLLIRTSLVVAVFGHHQALATMPDQLSNIVDHLQNGTSTPAARAMEQCLYKLQSQLDWKTRPQEPLPIEQSLSRVR